VFVTRGWCVVRVRGKQVGVLGLVVVVVVMHACRYPMRASLIDSNFCTIPVGLYWLSIYRRLTASLFN